MNPRVTFFGFLFCAVLFLTVSSTTISSGQPQNRGASGIRHANPPGLDMSNEYLASGGEYRSRSRGSVGSRERFRSGRSHRRDAGAIRFARPHKLGIPKGHFPPPGSYRLWFPGRPPGRQPAVVYHYDAVRYAPAGAWVIYRPAYDSRFVYVQLIHPRYAGVVIEVHVYDAYYGTYIRTEIPSRVRYRW